MGEMISIEDLRKVKGIGSKTINRIREQMVQSEDDKNYISEYDSSIHISPNELLNGDCLELMNGIPDKSVDMILADLPYGTTACKWDTIIPFDKLWKQYHRVIKDDGAIVLFGSEPFGSALRMSNINNYRYDWVWEKSKAGNFQIVKYQPLKYTENIMIFSVKPHNYYPIMREAKKSTISRRNYAFKGYSNENGLGHMSSGEFEYKEVDFDGMINPTNLIKFKSEFGLHPTQKPVELLEYLIKTYTNEGETVLDNVIGSGSTAIACINTNRNFIGIELDEEYFKIAKDRIKI